MTERLALVDLETTGADPRADRITEIGIVLIDAGVVVEEYCTLVDPGRTIPPGIETLTGITQAMVDGAPSFDDIALDVAARLNGRTLVAHNARFDYAFLRNEFRRAGLPLRSDVLCTVRLSRRLFPEQPRHNLDTLIARFGLVCDARHRALPDARLVHQLLGAFARQVGDEALRTAIRETVDGLRAPPGLDPDLLDDIPETTGVYTLHDAEGRTLYAGKAANLRSQVLAHFAERASHAAAQRAAIQAGRLAWTVTAGELGAALRHLQLIETLSPAHNRAARKATGAWGFRWKPTAETGAAPALVDLNDTPVDVFPDLCGPFRSREDALKALRGLAREHRLCASVLGLAPPGAPCAGAQDGACRGACVGREPLALHHMRAIQALSRLRLPRWPFAGAVGLIEHDRDRTRSEVLVVDAWRYLGSARDEAELTDLRARPDLLPAFDVDVFRLLRRALADQPRDAIVDLHASAPGTRDIRRRPA